MRMQTTLVPTLSSQAAVSEMRSTTAPTFRGDGITVPAYLRHIDVTVTPTTNAAASKADATNGVGGSPPRGAPV